MRQRTDGGWFELISGSMFSGKTEELIRRLRRAQYAKQRIQVFGPALDFRPGLNAIKSHNDQHLDAIVVNEAKQIPGLVDPATEVVGIDELQFFDAAIVDVIMWLVDQGKRVIGAGLNLNALGEPFGPMPELMVLADKVDTVNAICVVCGSLASRTQLLQNEKPIPWQEGPLILVGDEKTGYEARCPYCHDVPGKPKPEF